MKVILLLVGFLLTGFSVAAQATMSDVFNKNTDLVFLGLDLTQAKFVGSIGFVDADAIKNNHIVSWNNLIVAEPKKFSLQEAFKYPSDKYFTNVDDMLKLNKSVDVAGNTTEESAGFDKATVEKSVTRYKLTPKEGVGVVYVVESLQHTAKVLTAWVTFVDLKNQKVLYTERFEGKAAGFGFRNFWAGGVANINKSVAAKYKEWNKSMK